MTKKTGILSFVLLLLCVSMPLTAIADEGWQPFQPAATNGGATECVIVEPIGANPQVEGVLPPITDEDWQMGAKDVPLTILEYADFECPYCSFAGISLYEFAKKYPEDVRYVYRHFPLSFHSKAPMAAYAADAAGKQGLFFEAEHLLYDKQQDWAKLADLPAFENWLKEHFKSDFAELDFAQWEKDFADAELRAKVDQAFDDVVALNIIGGTPTIFLNMNSYQGGFDEAALKPYLDLFKLQQNLYTECPAMVIDPAKQYRAVMDTTKGQIVMDLYADKAPLTVNNFVFLASEGWYDGIAFHRIVPGFVAQAGDPSGTGIATPGYNFANEISDLKYDEPGIVGMANSGADKNGSQFFITFDLKQYYTDTIVKANDGASAESKRTDEQIAQEVQKEIDKMSSAYTIFGKVSSGMDVVDKLTKADLILSVKIEEK